MKNKQYILFDLDGTVTDPKVGITKAVQHALKHYGIEENNLDKLCTFIGPPLNESFEDLYGFSKKKAQEAILVYREYYSEKGIFENILYPNIRELLMKLKSNKKKIFMATSKPTVFAKEILVYFDIIKYFDFVGGSELNGERSQKDEVIKHVLMQNNINDISRCVMIGDRKYDIIGAKKFGMDTLGVCYGYGSKEEIKENNPTIVVQNVEELIDILI